KPSIEIFKIKLFYNLGCNGCVAYYRMMEQSICGYEGMLHHRERKIKLSKGIIYEKVFVYDLSCSSLLSSTRLLF
ncbi:hypothetical protein, partial [Holdemanella porci]|uniref:hypothetical protein n=1 Tax=Holdemanella porci TaxID=2652276 RepID=UPI0022E483C0